MADQQIGVEGVFKDAQFQKGIKQYDNSLNKATKQTDQFTSKANKDFQTFDKSLKGLGKGLLLGGALTQAGAMVSQFVGESVAEFQAFDLASREVFTLLPNLTNAAMMQMQDDILAFSAEAGRTTDTVIPALYQSISAGVPADNVFDFMKIASEAASGGVTDLETAVDGITSVVNAYGAETITAQEASDLLFTAVKGGKTTFDELSASVFNVVPSAASLGVSFDTVTAALASMTAQGVPTNVATTQLRGLMDELGKSTTEASKTFKEISGSSFPEFIANGGTLQQALQLLEQEADNTGIRISDLFGNIRAGQAALLLTGQGAEKFAAELDSAADSAGATTEAANTMSDSLQRAERDAAAAQERFQILTGQALEPAQRALLELKTTALDAASAILTAAEETAKLVEENKAAAGSIEELVAEGQRITETIEGFGQLRGAISNFIGVTPEMKDRLSEIVAELAASSSSTEEFQQALDNAFGGMITYGDELGRVTLESNNFGFAVVGNVNELEAMIRSADAAVADIKFFAQAEEEAAAAAELATRAEEEFGDELENVAEAADDTAREVQRASDAQDELSDKAAFATNALDEEALQMQMGEQAARAANIALRERVEAEEALAESARAAAEAEAALNASMGDFFVDALNAEAGAGFFDQALDQLGESLATVGGRTQEQNEDLSILQDAYDKAAEAIREYELGVKGANLSDEERAEKIAEQQGIIDSLGPKIAELNAITGEYITVNTEATINQDAVNQALFNAADAADASAEQLAILGGALGLYSDEAVEAALQSASIQAKIDELAQAYVDGSINVDEMRGSLQEFIAGLTETAGATEETTQSILGTTEALSESDLVLAEKLGLLEEEAQAREEGASAAFDEISESATTNMETVSTVVDENMLAVEEAMSTGFDEVTTSTEESMSAVEAAVAQGMSAVVTTVSTDLAAVVAAFDTNTTQIIDMTTASMGQFSDAVGIGIDQAISTSSAKVESFQGLGFSFVQGMAQGVRDGSGVLSQAVTDVVNEAIAAGQAAAESASPSEKAAREIGGPISQGIAKGAHEHSHEAEEAVADVVADSIFEGFTALQIGGGELNLPPALRRIFEERGNIPDFVLDQMFGGGSAAPPSAPPPTFPAGTAGSGPGSVPPVFSDDLFNASSVITAQTVEVNFTGDVTIIDQMDQDLFETRVRLVVAEAIG